LNKFLGDSHPYAAGCTGNQSRLRFHKSVKIVIAVTGLGGLKITCKAI
jgi:hypothetical protein